MEITGLCTGAGRRDGVLHLELRSDQSKEPRPLEPGLELAFEIVGGRRCIGYRPPEATSLIPCPDHADALSAAQCPACFERAKIRQCLRCTGERCTNPERRPSCVQPENHAVYLASFGPGMLKVGVARWERRFERLAEQGARAALIVARDDGQQVRRMEAQIERAERGDQKIPDRRSPGEKLRGLTHPVTNEQLLAEIRERLPRLRLRVLGQWLKEPEELELPELPLLESPPRILAPKVGLRLRGKIFAVAGAILIVDLDTGERVALEVASLIGYQLRALAQEEVAGGQLALALA